MSRWQEIIKPWKEVNKQLKSIFWSYRFKRLIRKAEKQGDDALVGILGCVAYSVLAYDQEALFRVTALGYNQRMDDLTAEAKIETENICKRRGWNMPAGVE